MTLRLVTGAVILVASVITITMWLPGASPSGSGDYPTYETVVDLAAASDVVVHGIIGDASTSFVDYGGEPEEEGAGVSMLVQDVFVVSVVASPLTESTLRVARLDPDVFEGVSALLPGQEVILFLEHVTSTDAPGIVVVADELWVVVSGEEGVFDVVDGMAIPRANPDRVLSEGGSTLGSGIDVADLLAAASSLDADENP